MYDSKSLIESYTYILIYTFGNKETLNLIL